MLNRTRPLNLRSSTERSLEHTTLNPPTHGCSFKQSTSRFTLADYYAKRGRADNRAKLEREPLDYYWHAPYYTTHPQRAEAVLRSLIGGTETSCREQGAHPGHPGSAAARNARV